MPKEIIEKAIKYIRNCTTADGGVQYNSKGGGAPPGDHRPRPSPACSTPANTTASTFPSCRTTAARTWTTSPTRASATGTTPTTITPRSATAKAARAWEEYRDKVYDRLVKEASPEGCWNQGYIGTVYTTAINLTILQLENASLPIYQR